MRKFRIILDNSLEEIFHKSYYYTFLPNLNRKLIAANRSFRSESELLLASAKWSGCEEKNTAISSSKIKLWSEVNRTEWGGESIRLYIRGNVFSNDVRRLFSVVSCLPRRRQRRMERSRGGRDGSRWKETAQGPAPFFFWPSYCGSLLHAGCPRPAKGLSQPWNEANARCRLRSPPRERNTLSGEVERQKVTDDRLLVNPVMALPLTIIIGWQGQRAQKTLQPLFHAGARTMERIENRSYVSLVTRLNWIERVSVDGKR